MANFATIIGIDKITGNIYFITQTEGPDTAQIKTVPFKATVFTDAFYTEFEQILSDYAVKNPSTYQNGVIMVLPDNAVYMDSFHLPVIKGKQLDTSIDVALSNMFNNLNDLNVNKQKSQNKQFTTVSLVCMRKALTQGIYAACSPNKLMPKKMTFAANGMVQTFGHIHPKLAGTSYILVNVKEHSCHMALVCHGQTAGYYSLPFGHSILKPNRLAAEDMLFDHTLAEITVLNAREKAKAKALTVIDDSASSDSEDGDGDSQTTTQTEESSAATFKKQARKLPKFMLRPQPEDEEGYINENFRIIMRWILLFKMRNEQLWEGNPPQAVYINLPNEFEHVIAYANTEQEENGIEFKPMTTAADRCPQNLLLYPEFFGALFPNKYNTINLF